MAAKREKIHFQSVDELLGAPVYKEGTEEIDIDKIVPFKNHPFKVLDDEKMMDLVESIKKNGVLTPVLVRPLKGGIYEMISGHRRLHAAKLAELKKIPAIIKELTDDEAIIIMVDSNVQREEILPSERAFSLKMKMDAMRRQGTRTDLDEDATCRTECDKIGKKTAEIVGEGVGLKARQVQKYIRLTDLSDELLQYVDEKKIPIGMAADISYFDKEVQRWVYEYRKDNGFLKQEQIDALKNCSNLDNLTQYSVIQVMNEALPKTKVSGRVALSEKKLNKYFPSHMSAYEREHVILTLLEQWKRSQKTEDKNE